MPATRKKKKFIDKKNAVSFHLVHRSQKDPLQADEDAPQRVLLPATTDKSKQLEEQQKYGIYFEDEYDYMQHLKEVSEVTEWVPAKPTQEQDEELMSEASTVLSEPKLRLPGSVFGSTVERDVGVLNMAAPSSGPKLDWDPEVVAALDEDFNFDDPANILDDDFVLKANASGDEGNMEAEDGELDDFIQQAGGASSGGYMLAEYMRRNLQLKDEEGVEDDEDVEEGSDIDSADVEYSDDDDFSDEDDHKEKEGKGTYSRYSVSSSVLPRNDNLKLLDAWFDKVIEDYNDDNIGALDHEELNGRVTMDSDLMKQALADFEKSQQKLTMRDIVDSREKGDHPVLPKDGEEESGSEAESNNAEYEWRVVEDDKPKWDCETIISTYSTTKNLPKTIYSESEKRRLDRAKTKEPKQEEPTGLTIKDIEKEMAHDRADRAFTLRLKGESAEERKSRKKAVKMEQMERRMEKKANKLAFREENNRQKKQKASSSVNQGARIEYR